MKQQVYRVFVEKTTEHAVEAAALCSTINELFPQIPLTSVRILNRYDIDGITEEDFPAVLSVVAEKAVDTIYIEEFPFDSTKETVFAWEYLPGQFDQRADSAAQCIQIITQKERPIVHNARVIVLTGQLSSSDIDVIKHYIINPVDSREAAMTKPDTLVMDLSIPTTVETLTGFIEKTPEEVKAMAEEMGLAMTYEDLLFCQKYFRDEEHRDPTITEIRVIDTYWSDHCRHTTFLTKITDVQFGSADKFAQAMEATYQAYLESREETYGARLPQKSVCLMDLATLAAKELKAKGLLDGLDESEEINACSIKAHVMVDGKPEHWLIMFKNETHNHPTEIEPFGGASTCLGGAIRDPLSGRSFVYQAMRVTGSASPLTPMADTLPGKLPQRKLTREAAKGYSSYGNQIGLATGQVAEVYHPDFVAKRFELGAVIAAAPEENVIRTTPLPGDVVLLVGGKTGRDGCGGATGSSKEHDEKSLTACGAEVQKGNAPTERKIQRLFRNKAASTLIKRCNDFGAGGVSVAIGELTDGLDIFLDTVPKKYEGLDGTELAISESQERMAVVVAAENSTAFIRLAQEENLECTQVAVVTDTNRLRMVWKDNTIVDINRDFLNTNGVQQEATVTIASPSEADNFFQQLPDYVKDDAELEDIWYANLADLNTAGQKGLAEQFDSSIGAGTVLMPFGGKYQLSPAIGMAAKVPVLHGETTTATLMTYGYHPYLASWSPYHGGLYSVVEAISKLVAMGGDYKKAYLSCQEYFEKLGNDPAKWGKPFAALLGAFQAEKSLGIGAIGGKDSMSGTFKDIHVPPTLVTFAVTVTDTVQIISSELKSTNSHLVVLPVTCDINEIPDFDELKTMYEKVTQLIHDGWVLSSATVGNGGIAAAVSKMAFGNKIGVKFSGQWFNDELFTPEIGSIILELDGDMKEEEIEGYLSPVEYEYIGHTYSEANIVVNDTTIPLDKAIAAWMNTLEKVFPTKTKDAKEAAPIISYDKPNVAKPHILTPQPKVFIPVFPGTNCEYDTARAFEQAGAIAQTYVVKNLSTADIEQSVSDMVKIIGESQIIAFPGGFSAGDEPDGSGKFISAFFNHPKLIEAVDKHLQQNDGLIIGICNGFQALIKLGLVPYGKIVPMTEESPTLSFNKIGRHISCMVQTKVVSNLSPWLSECKLGDVYTIPASHGEGRFVAPADVIADLIKNGQVATQYVNEDGIPTLNTPYNPNGSMAAIEGITSPDGRVFGKMGHSERITKHTALNIPGNKVQPIFAGGVNYFK